MKDEFLKSYWKEPPAEVAENVYRRIQMIESKRVVAEEMNAQPRHRWSKPRPIALAGMIVLLLLLLSPLFSSTVRALMEDVVHQIGGLTLLETDVYPGTSEALLEPDEVTTLAQAREMVSFSFSLPAAVPGRYTMAEGVTVIPGFNSVTVNWINESERGDGFSLTVSPAVPDVKWVAGPDSIEVVKINGKEAQFITGGWEKNREIWNPDIARLLRWEQDGVEYRLSAGGANSCPDREEYRCPLSREEMIEIAASVSPVAPAGE